jgi:tetratricopeptide (TPR) repeat protein
MVMESKGEKIAGSDEGARLTQPSVNPPTRRSRFPLMLGATVLAVLLIVGTVLVVALLRGSGDSPDETLRKAQEAQEAGDYAEASEQFEKILDGDPGNVEALAGLLGIAGEQVEAWNFGHAITAFEKVLEADPDNVEALKGIGEVHESQEDWQQAIDWYEKWLQVAPDDAAALLALGWGEYRLEHYVDAEAYFKRAREVMPDNLSSFLGLGRVYFAEGDYVQSLGFAEKAAELAPDGSVEQDQVMQLLKELAWVSLDTQRLLTSSRRYAEQGNDAALQQINQWIVEQIRHPRDMNLGDRIRFLGYELQDLSGGQVQIDLYFQGLAPMNADYEVWMHARVNDEEIDLLPPERQPYGFVNWGHKVGYPTSQWVEGAIYLDRIVRQVAPGGYHLIFGVWLPEQETRLATADDPIGAVDLGWHAVGGE